MLILSETNGGKDNVYFPMEDNPCRKIFINKRNKERNITPSFLQIICKIKRNGIKKVLFALRNGR